MRRPFSTPAALTLALGLTLAGAAGAADSLFSGREPVHVSADNFTTSDATHTATYSGRVEFFQTDRRLRANTVVVYFAGQSLSGAAASPAGGLKGFTRMEADGNVFFVSPGQVIRGDHATYEAASKTLQVTGTVVLQRGDDVMAGSRLVVHMATNSATLDNETGTGRVRTVINPTQGAPPAAPTK